MDLKMASTTNNPDRGLIKKTLRNQQQQQTNRQVPPTHSSTDRLEWTDETETLFFQAFLSKSNVYKPTGLNKHFHMLIAYNRFVKSVKKNVDVEVLWDKLEQLYQLPLLESVESSIPFPNEHRDFILPDKFRSENDATAEEKGSKKKKRRLNV